MPASRPTPARRIARQPLALLVVALAACSGGSDPAAPDPIGPPPPPPPPPPTLTIAATPATITVPQGQSATVTLSVARGSHDAAVVLGAVTGNAAGVIASLAPATVPQGQSESVVTLATSATTPVGEHTVTIDGAGGGASARTSVVVRVTAAPVQSYTLAVAPSPVAVTAGGAPAAASVAIARSHFAGGVTLVASGAPGGLVVSLPATPVAADAAALSVQAAAGVVPGDYPITVTGSADGLAPVSAGFVVRVSAAPREAGVVTGVALDGRGRPIANAMVVVKMVWNPNDVRTRTGPDGRYTVRGLPPGLTHQIWAWHEFTHGGRSYCSRLAMATPAEYEAFVPGDGAVRDFRWQLTGRIPDAGGNHFGASIALVATSELWESLQDGDDIELRLVPDGPLVDGSEASVITRTIPFARSGWASRVDDLPHGTYTAAVTRIRGGVRTALAVGRLGSGTRAPTAAVRWEPAHSPGSCGQVLGADLQTFSLQIAPE